MAWGIASILTIGLWLHNRLPPGRGPVVGSEGTPSKEDVLRAQQESARAGERARSLYERWRSAR